METIRLDKWLWAARFFKTRSLAARACELGRVLSNQQPVKPARGVHLGETFEVRTENGEYEVQVLGLSEIRGPAPIAGTLYEETQSSRDKRRKLAEERHAGVLFSPAPKSRPSKRDRRKLRDFRGQ
jgi:ribosome-associated heat shock protein Hsp15